MSDTRSPERDALRGELLELCFDCHPDPAALRARIEREPELAELYEEVRATAALLAEAARAPAPELAQLTAAALAGRAVAPGRARGRRWPPLLVAAGVLWAAGIAVPLGLWGARAYELDRAETCGLRLVLSGPSAIPDAMPARFRAETWNLRGEAMAADVVWRVLSDGGAELASGRVASAGSVDLEVPARLDGPAVVEVSATSALGGSQRASLRLEPAAQAPLAHLATDKPAYRPGETVRLRAVVLDRQTLEPRPDAHYRLRVTDARGAVATRLTGSTHDGVLAAEWTIPEGVAGGDYAFELRDAADAFAFEREPFLVRLYQPPRLAVKLDLDRETYAPGASGSAELSVERAGGGPAAGATALATLVIDGAQVWREETALDAAGRAVVRFTVPAQVERGDAMLAARITDGGVVETRVEPFVVPTGKVEVAFFPEGGDLIEGRPNRVYAEVTDPLGRPLSARGEVVDGTGTAVAAFATEHQGRARFELTPRPGARYRLRFDEPAAEPVELPAAAASGVVLRAGADAVAAGDALRLAVHTPHRGPWIVGAFLRGTLVGHDTFEGEGRHELAIDLPDRAAGVLRATVFDARLRPVAERLVHRASRRRLTIDVQPGRDALAPGERQTLALRVRTEAGDPVHALLGVTVTDRAVRDLVGEARIGLADRTWLAADVEELEDVEEFVAGGPDAERRVDLLLGTRGWRRFLWARTDAADALAAELGERAQRLLAREGHGQVPAVADVAPSLAALRDAAGHARERALGALVLSFAVLLLAGVVIAARRVPAGIPRLVGASAAAAGVVVLAALYLGSAPRFAAGGPGGAFVAEDAAPAPQREVALEAEDPMTGYRGPSDIRPPQGELVAWGADVHFAGDGGEARKQLPDAGDLGRVGFLQQPVAAGVRLLRVTRDHAYAHHHQTAAARGDFAETVLWQPSLATDGRGEAEAAFDLSDRVTTWSVYVDAHGAGRVGQAATEFDTRLPLHVEPVVPDEVSQGDRLRLPVAVDAEGAGAATVEIVAGATGALALEGAPRQEVALAAGRGRAVVELDVLAPAPDTALTLDATAGRFRDRVRHSVRVVPRGFPHHVARSGVLRDSVEVEVPMPEASVRGSMSSVLRLFPSPLATLGEGMEGMLQQPGGCFEQASSTNYPNVMVLSFLDATGSEAPAMSRRAREVLGRGYELLTGYECASQGFEWFGHDPGHEALTAYGLLEFSDMAAVFPVADELIARTRAWLLARRDGDGGYRRNPKALDRFGAAPQSITDAYATYALAATGTPADELAAELDRLEQRARETEDAYELALAACALRDGGRKDAAAAARQRLAGRQDAGGSLTGSTTSITSSRRGDLTVETTSFAVLAWLGDDRYRPHVEKATEYLLGQRTGSGTFGATQATVMALKALTEHARLHHRTAAAGALRIWVNDKLLLRDAFPEGAQEPMVYRDLHQLMRPGVNRIRIALSGDNEFPWTFDLGYHAEQPADDPQAPLELDTRLATADLAEGDTVALAIRLRNVAGEGLPMTIASVGLPAGLHADHRVLDERKAAGRFDLWELRGRELVLYWRGLAPAETREVSVDLVARVPGRTRGPASRAWPYYTPEAVRWAMPLEVDVTAR